VDVYVANGNRSGRSAADYCTRFWCHDIYVNSSAPQLALSELFRRDQAVVGRDISWNGYEHDCLLLNLAGSGFVNVAFLYGLALEPDSRQVIADDFDADGRPDLLVGWADRSGPQARLVMQLFRNAIENERHWVGVRLGNAPARAATGAKVRLKNARGTRVETHVIGDSFSSQHSPVVHFGLGDVDRIDVIEVHWADGTVTTLTEPAVDQYHEAVYSPPSTAL
jgi:hypothetical protein